MTKVHSIELIEKARPRLPFWKAFGPGLITGASDDDPSGIATYSQAGAQFGYSMLWTMVFTYPLMSAIQAISARIGRVTGHGIAENLRRHYNKPLMFTLVALLLVANVINIGADIGAMGEAAQLLFGGYANFYAIGLALLSVGLLITVPYKRYVNILKWMTLALFSYVIVIFLVDVEWQRVIYDTFIPKITFDQNYALTLVGVFGTTISPYMFFWQSSQEVEEVKRSSKRHPLKKAPDQAGIALYRIKLDTLIGMGFSNVVAYFIILAASATLHAHGATNIETAAQAAEALRPIAGEKTFLLFALGIIGTGMLALPVLAGSAAFAIGEAFKFRVGLEKKPHEAKRFYSVIAISTLLGVLMGFFHIDPIRALYWAAVINGLIAVPLMVMIMHMASNKAVMGPFTVKLPMRTAGWAATILMLVAIVSLAFAK